MSLERRHSGTPFGGILFPAILVVFTASKLHTFVFKEKHVSHPLPIVGNINLRVRCRSPCTANIRKLPAQFHEYSCGTGNSLLPTTPKRASEKQTDRDPNEPTENLLKQESLSVESYGFESWLGIDHAAYG